MDALDGVDVVTGVATPSPANSGQRCASREVMSRLPGIGGITNKIVVITAGIAG